jgi:hypothetical protein
MPGFITSPLKSKPPLVAQLASHAKIPFVVSNPVENKGRRKPQTNKHSKKENEPTTRQQTKIVEPLFAQR